MAIRAEDIDIAADRTLVERYQAGDERAFDELYGRYFDRLRSFCQRKVGDRSDAEEIAQEAFVKALVALPSLSGDRRFYPWVTVIASRLCIDHYRRQARVQPAAEVDTGIVEGDLGRDLVHQAELADLDAALHRITERHRTVLDLRERKGLSYAEIALDLDVPQTTVETLLFRARKALRREYLAVCGDGGRLAGLPILGGLGLRLRSLRVHLAEVRPDLASLAAPVAAGAAAVALTAGVVLSGTDGPTTQLEVVPPATAAPAAEIAEPAPPTSPSAPGEASAQPLPVAAAPGEREVPPTVAAPVETSDERQAPNPIVPGATVSNDPEAFDEAEEMPIATDTDPATVGADPVAGADALLRQLFERTP